MPPLQFAPGVARVTCVGSYTSGSPGWANVFHVRKLGGAQAPYTQADIDLVAQGFFAAYGTNIMPSVGNGASLTSATAIDIGSDVGVTGVVSGTTVGSAVPPFLSQGNSMCISWTQGSHFRGGHPRTYTPLHTTAQTLNTREWTAGAAAGLRTGALNFRTAVNAIATSTGVELVLLRRIRNQAVLIPPLTFPITSANVDLRIDTQRRRLGPDV